MNLPLILDLAIGLIFIYLILSLLSSEIQELITTVLQWRAEHLKKSIEGLLAGGGSDVGDKARELTDQLYNDPLMQSLNHEARGLVAPLFRKIPQAIGSFIRSIMGLKNTFGYKRSAPSYVPAETFATTLLNTLQLEPLYEKIAESRFKTFVQEQLKNPIQNILASLRDSRGDESLFNEQFEYLQSRIDEIADDYKKKKATLENSVDRIANQITRFRTEIRESINENNQLHDHVHDIFLKRLSSLQQTVFENENDKQVLLRNLKPTMSQVVDEFNKMLEVYRITRFAIDETGEFDEAILARLPEAESTRYLQLRESFNLLKEFSTELKKHGSKLERVFDHLPPYLQESLPVLAKRAETKITDTSQSIHQFQVEIESWFDNSMERASGVYKRNAKGVALCIGFIIAVAANADTFYMVGRLSKDTVLRNTIAESASQAAQTPADLAAVRNTVDQQLSEITLPIGWSPQKMQELREAGQTGILANLKRLVGWLISGVAISMGANFWFNLLGKVVNVRNAGSPPRPIESSTSSGTSVR
jgi:regulator of replication initiation timing